MRTCVYYSNWSVYSRKHFPEDIPLDYTTNIFYAFFNIDPSSGEVKLSDSWADVEMPFKPQFDTHRKKIHGLLGRFYEIKRHNRHVKVSMSIGGWSNRENFKDGVSSDTKLEKFVDSAVSLMMQYGFDGIDLDWEYPEDSHQAKRYLILMRKLKAKFRAIEYEHNLKQDSFLLTIASPAFADKLNLFNIKEMDRYLSFWNLMTYDFAGEWSETTGYHCNLYSKGQSDLCADDGVKYLIKEGVDSSKIVLGMANYGRSFTNTCGYGHPFHGVGDGSSDEKGIWNYNRLPFPGTQEMFDANAVIAFCYDQKTRKFISYDNTESVEKKGEYARCMKLGGGMWWESCGDNYKDPSRSLIHHFVKSIGGREVLDKSPNIIDIYSKSDYLKN
jgi:chitinase